jgi:hypothetical protein
LTAQETDATFQWIDCSSDQIIQGETDQSYTFDTEGSYAVEITKNGCIDTSSCHIISVLGVVENNLATNLSVFPNPANQQIHINFGGAQRDVDIRLIDQKGQMVMTRYYDQQKYISIDVGQLPPGLYILLLRSKEKQAKVRFLRSN